MYRIYLYPIVPNDWVSMFERERLVGALNPWASVYFGSKLTNIDFQTGGRSDFNNTEAGLFRH